MNPLLQVKLRFINEKNPQKPGPRNLRANAETSIQKIDGLIEDLNEVLRYYRSIPKILSGILIDVNYNDIIAKSNRIKEVFKPLKGNTNDLVVGARFSDAPSGEENHIITYYVDFDTVINTVENLQTVKVFLHEKLDDKATTSNFKKPDCAIDYDGYGLSETQLRDIIIDCSVIDSFSVPHISSIPDKERFLITFYKTELSLTSIMEKLKIDELKYPYFPYGKDTISITKDLYAVLDSQIPYMISMISTDLSKISYEEAIEPRNREKLTIPNPQNEPIIGVIDTLFDDTVYFNEWVDYRECLDEIERINIQPQWKEHGTEVTSLIVDGPSYNPWLDDGCGRFRVRHFGVCGDRISISRLVRKIKRIICENPEIHVWNLSLGTEDEVSNNFISFDAAAIDELQAQHNIIFVISGTNDNRTEKDSRIRVGSPADSLNSIVVNSVKKSKRISSYSRRGNVLSFFNKPDVSYYGGDYDEKIVAYSPYGLEYICGTSYAAPWISRKLCYLIDVVGLPREVAKALLIDSAAGWDYKKTTYKKKDLYGYGIVPIDINDVITTKNDEIRFVVYGTSQSYKTTNYAIPVPRDKEGKYPFIARATLCYFPECLRAQGVDYTKRELSLKFGRINDKGVIVDINDNIQDDVGTHMDERQSRKEFRKWENTKFISKIVKKNRPLKSYQDRLWGISIVSKERLRSSTGKGLNFGIVITLHDIFGDNRIQDFIRACNLRGWIVNEISIKQRVEVYNANQEEIHFET